MVIQLNHCRSSVHHIYVWRARSHVVIFVHFHNVIISTFLIASLQHHARIHVTHVVAVDVDQVCKTHSDWLDKHKWHGITVHTCKLNDIKNTQYTYYLYNPNVHTIYYIWSHKKHVITLICGWRLKYYIHQIALQSPQVNT